MSSSPTRGKNTRGHVGCLKTLNQWPDTSRGSILHFNLFLFSVLNPKTSLFLPNLKIQIEIHHFLSLIVNHLCKENPSLCSILEPLYCSSFATIVGGNLGL